MISPLLADGPGWVPTDASTIDQAGVDIAVVPPATPVPPLGDVDALPVGRIDTVVPRGSDAAPIAAAIARLGLTAPALPAWILAAVERFAAITGADAVKLRAEITADVTCPKFHVDSVHVRLVSTLHGAGTEFAHRDEPSQIHRAGTGDLVLLKGRRHPTHTDTVKHRSPPMATDERRVVLVLDC
jgi:hypothetical protein